MKYWYMWDRARVCVTPTDPYDLFIIWYDAYGNRVAGGASSGVVDSDGNAIVINTTLDSSYDEKQCVSRQ